MTKKPLRHPLASTKQSKTAIIETLTAMAEANVAAQKSGGPLGKALCCASFLASLANTLKWLLTINPDEETAEIIIRAMRKLDVDLPIVHKYICKVSSVLDSVRQSPISVGPIVASNAHQACIKLITEVVKEIWIAAAPNEFALSLVRKDGKNLDYGMVKRNIRKVSEHFKSLQIPDGNLLEAEAQIESARAAEMLASNPSKKADLEGRRAKGRGRAPDPDYNPEADERLCENWAAAKRQGAGREEFCNAKGINVSDLIHTQDRVRYRHNRDKELKSVKNTAASVTRS